jgi:flagellar motor switch protein FliM
VFEEMRFAEFYAGLRRPRPIYFVELAPLPGQGLLLVDNRFSAFCLRDRLPPEGSAGGVRLTPANQTRLQRVVQALLRDFDRSWADVHPVRAHLRKITTYPFRARILNPYESCLVAQIHLAGRNVSARLTWCLPRVMLEPVLPALRGGAVLPPLLPPSLQEAQAAEPPGRETVLNWLSYGLQLRMGQLTVGATARHLAVGAVMPLRVEPGNAAVVELEGRPVLRATPGAVEGRYAFRVDATYEEPGGPIADPTRFRPLRWRSAPGE